MKSIGDTPQARATTCAKVTLIFIVGIVLSGCLYPPPVYVRQSSFDEPPPGKAVIHAVVLEKDPLGLFPSNKRCSVSRIDERVWSKRMRSDASNRITIEPGRRWIQIKIDLLLAPPSWVAFEIDAEPGSEYSLSSALGGCHAALGIGLNRVIPYEIQIDEIRLGKVINTMDVEGICAASDTGDMCKSDVTCTEGLSCVVTGETGLGMCGLPTRKFQK